MNLKRVLIKVSGEMLAGKDGTSIDDNHLKSMAESIKRVYETNIKIAVVIGAGNIIRGTSNQFLQRTTADSAGILGTVINALTLKDILYTAFKIPAVILGSFSIDGMFQQSTPALIDETFNKNAIIIFAGGLGVPYFSTDTSGVLRALEIKANLMIKATKVDGIYNKDPIKFPDAVKINTISYAAVLEQKLKIMDFTAISLAMENHLPICVTNLTHESLISVIRDQSSGTIIS